MTAIHGVLFDFGLTLGFPQTFEEAVRAAGRDLGRSDRQIDEFIEAVYAVEDHPDVQAAEVRRDVWPEAHRAADMAYAIACDADQELMAAFHDRCIAPNFYTLYEDAIGVLVELRRRGLRIGVLSNCGWNLRDNLVALDVAHLVDAVTSRAPGARDQRAPTRTGRDDPTTPDIGACRRSVAPRARLVADPSENSRLAIDAASTLRPDAQRIRPAMVVASEGDRPTRLAPLPPMRRRKRRE